MKTPQEISQEAEQLAIKKLSGKGWNALSVHSKKNKERIKYLFPKVPLKGFDVFRYKGSKKYERYEVKGTHKEYGIPDLFQSEFRRGKKLVAEFLYVVHIPEHGRPRPAKIPGKNIDPHRVRIVKHYKISSVEKKRLLKQARKR